MTIDDLLMQEIVEYIDSMSNEVLYVSYKDDPNNSQVVFYGSCGDWLGVREPNTTVEVVQTYQEIEQSLDYLNGDTFYYAETLCEMLSEKLGRKLFIKQDYVMKVDNV